MVRFHQFSPKTFNPHGVVKFSATCPKHTWTPKQRIHTLKSVFVSGQIPKTENLTTYMPLPSSSTKSVSSPSISPSQTTFVIILPQKRDDFTIARAPIPRFTCRRTSPLPHRVYTHQKAVWSKTNFKNPSFFLNGDPPVKHRLSPSISPSQTNFWDIYPQKTTCFLRPCVPMPPLSDKSSGTRGAKFHHLTFHITELNHFCRHLTSKNGVCFPSPIPRTFIVPHPPGPGTKTPLYIPYHRLGPLLWTFNLKKRGKKDDLTPHSGFICRNTRAFRTQLCAAGVSFPESIS